MSAPQIKERPASMLRAMFAGFGSLMSVVDKVRGKPAAEAPSDAEASAPATASAPEATASPAPEAAAPEAAVAPEVSTGPETVTPEATAETAKSGHPETVAAEIPVAAEPSGELPLANYDELTVASLRARLRNLSNDDLSQLMAYEKAHQNRPEVIKMFQNRLIKMTSGLPKLEA